MDFSSHSETLNRLKESQDAQHDLRETVREVKLFLSKPDGQWEPDVHKAFHGRPRYTFDMSNDLVDDINGKMIKSEFGIKVKPAGGDATIELAKTYDGLIRNIQSISDASRIYDKAGRNVVAAGLDGWEVIQDWASDDSMNQDLLIRGVPNFVDCVWFDPNAVLEDMSDAKYAFKLKTMSLDEYEKKWPKGKKVSIGDDRSEEVYHDKAPDPITIGSAYYKEPAKRELVEMSNGAVYIVDDKFEQVVDDLAAQGVTEVRRRTRDINEIKMRLFDGSDWLNDEQDTVFQFIPLVPAFGNFEIAENKVIFWGTITNMSITTRCLERLK